MQRSSRPFSVAVPLTDAAMVLLRPPEDWFPRAKGAGMWTRSQAIIHAHESSRYPRARVYLEVGPSAGGPDEATVPVRWIPRRGRLLPTMHGRIQVQRKGTGSEVTVHGSYDPPLGALGRWLDRIIMRRITGHTLDALAERIAARISTLVARDRADRDRTAPDWGDPLTDVRRFRSGHRSADPGQQQRM